MSIYIITAFLSMVRKQKIVTTLREYSVKIPKLFFVLPTLIFFYRRKGLCAASKPDIVTRYDLLKKQDCFSGTYVQNERR